MNLKFYILSILFTIFLFSKSEAQSSVQLFEGGIQFYVPVSVGGNIGGNPSSIGAGLQADFRVNLPKSKFDIGIFTQFGKTFRDYWFINLNEDIYRCHNSSFTTSTIGVNSNYNFSQGRKINPYAGLGIGVAFHDSHIACISNSATLSVIPEAGVEMFHHLRIAIRYNINKRSFNQLQFAVGFTIGGVPKN